MKSILFCILFFLLTLASKAQTGFTDTVFRVYLIYSDTSNTKGVMWNVNVRHMMGKMVVGGQQPVYTDKRGKPLPKNYIVWMAIPTGGLKYESPKGVFYIQPPLYKVNDSTLGYKN